MSLENYVRDIENGNPIDLIDALVLASGCRDQELLEIQ